MEISKKRFSFEEMLDSNFLTVEMKSQITQELIEILMEKMRNYTGGDSSLSKERTQSLMDSILYTLSFFLRNMDIQEMTALFTNQNITEIYQQSYQYLLQELHNLYIRVIELQHHQLHIPFRVYQDTIEKGMQAFFEVYNFDYCSQDIVLTLDYPACCPLKEKGLERMIEYVSYLEKEHEFLNCFEENDIESVLKGYCFYDQEMIDNISLLLMNQLLVKHIIGDGENLLFEKNEQVDQLYYLLSSHSSKELYDILYRQLEILIMNLSITHQQEIFHYYTFILDNLVSLLQHHYQFHTLEKAIACAF